ncbi:MAG TPA: 4Fe-4S dicluster domain-containing protein [Polyangiales bacterium]|nr:4Fe-4S dicluster domain-containing protein [Polyangiales bacterium]
MSERLHSIRPRSGLEHELTRRRFLELVAASAAIGCAPGCSQSPPEKIMPYVRQPRDVIPGISVPYATSLLIDGFATGLIAQTREGRPIKIDGNPDHPSSLGATSVFHQASVLQLYDPDRGSAVLKGGTPASWDDVLTVISRAPAERLRLLLEPTSSPLVHALLAEVKRRFPEARATFYAPLRSLTGEQASVALFGRVLAPVYDLSRARCVVALDSDLLGSPHNLRHARDFAARRKLAQPSDEPSRLYALEAALSVTGSMADERLARASGRIAQLTAALASEVLPGSMQAAGELDPRERRFIQVLARELRALPAGSTLIVPGDRQPSEVHVLAHAMNLALGNLGRTVRLIEAVLPPGPGDQTIAELAREMQAGKVETLLVLGGNPAYDAPADLSFSDALSRVRTSVYSGLYRNETARLCQWFAPAAHTFESWGDGHAEDGTWSVVQPLIRPLNSGKTTTELLAVLAELPAAGDQARLRARFGAARNEVLDPGWSAAERGARQDLEVSRRWQQLLAAGFAQDSAFPAQTPSARNSAAADALRTIAASAPRDSIELNLLPSPTLHDGSFANVAWLLELPEPITKLTWDNAALISAATASRLGIATEASSESTEHPLVELRQADRVLRLPALIAPGHADDAVSVWLGYGRQGDERLARGVGVDAYRMRTHSAPYFLPGAQLTVLEERYPLAITQQQRTQHGREIALTTTLARYRLEPDFTREHKKPQPSLYEPTTGSGPQWAMTIDLSACTGCSACMVACQAENNVLSVGKEQVRRGRVMHWLRIDSYVEADDRLVHQPMACQHCEKAPCEYVCPVNATVHSPDGLNEMVYNRCIGTRFCSNNCPYKVRRFNWFDWVVHQPANQGRVELQRNPGVSVRERGVMEKCTYCVQRIRAAEIDARKQDRPIAVGAVVTACQQACPTQAISFGTLEREQQLRQQARSYAALHDTNAQPRTMYLARIDNPNPEIAS